MPYDFSQPDLQVNNLDCLISAIIGLTLGVIFAIWDINRNKP